MPELPEVETARRLIADLALGRRIVGVDDADTFVCRPHSPGELRAALTGRTLTAAHRRGKTMWCETSGLDGSAISGPDLGIHLGMSGQLLRADPKDPVFLMTAGFIADRLGRRAQRPRPISPTIRPPSASRRSPKAQGQSWPRSIRQC